MKCEHCQNEHVGEYGSGRFCSSRCARSFSTSVDRGAISERVSGTMKGRPPSGLPFHVGFDSRRPSIFPAYDAKKEPKLRRKQSKPSTCLQCGFVWHGSPGCKGKFCSRKCQDIYVWERCKAKVIADELVSLRNVRRYLMETVPHCTVCEISEWQDKPLVLHLHHKDGNSCHHRLSNCELLCPNCHSQTDNFTGKNVGQNNDKSVKYREWYHRSGWRHERQERLKAEIEPR